jgi:hypothetical protein
MKRGWVLVVAAVVLAGAAFGVGYAVGDDGDGASDYGLSNDPMAMMMTDGSFQTMMNDFTTMMSRLRRSMTPEMRQQMDRDDMWRLMDSGELQDMMEQLGETMRQMPGMHGAGDGHRGG